MQVYVEISGERQGPYDANEILSWMGSGKLRPTDQVWIEGTGKTFPASELLPASAFGTAGAASIQSTKPYQTSANYRRKTSGIGRAAGIVALLGGLAVLMVPLIYFLFSVFVAGSFQLMSMNHRHNLAQKNALSKLRIRIEAHVNSHADAGVVTLKHLKDAGVVGWDDRRLMSNLGAEYQPFSADSPNDTVTMIVSRKGLFCLEETYYYKNQQPDHRHRWEAPNKTLAVVFNRPDSYGDIDRPKHRAITLLDQRSGKSLKTFPTDASRVRVQWRPDHQAVAIEEELEAFNRHVTVLLLARDGIVETSLPEEIQPKYLLPDQYRAQPHAWESTNIYISPWKDDVLYVTSSGRVNILKDDKPVERIQVHYYLGVRFTSDGEAVVVERKHRPVQHLPPS